MAGVAALLVFLVIQLRVIVMPLMIAVLVSSLLVPFASWLQRQGWPKWLAVMTAALTAAGAITALVYLIVTQIRAGWPDLQAQSLVAWERLKQFLLESPLHITEEQLTQFGESFANTIQENTSTWIGGVLSVGSTAGQLVAGLLITLFASLFILIDGRNIWDWVVRLFPRRARLAVDGAGAAGWVTLSNFVECRSSSRRSTRSASGSGHSSSGLPARDSRSRSRCSSARSSRSSVRVVTGALAVFIALVYKDRCDRAHHARRSCCSCSSSRATCCSRSSWAARSRCIRSRSCFAVAAGSYVAGIPGALFAVPIVATAQRDGHLRREWEVANRHSNPERTEESCPQLIR